MTTIEIDLSKEIEVLIRKEIDTQLERTPLLGFIRGTIKRELVEELKEIIQLKSSISCLKGRVKRLEDRKK